MANEDNNPLEPLQHTGLSPSDKAQLRSNLIDIMQAQETSARSQSTSRPQRRRRGVARLPGVLAGAAAVVVAGVIVVGSIHGPRQMFSHMSAGTTTATSGTDSAAGSMAPQKAAAPSTPVNGESNVFSSSSISRSPILTMAPVEVVGLPGTLESMQSWPLKGATLQNTGGPMSAVQYSSSGFTIGGVHWTWPASDTNPSHYIVVPTTVGSKPYLVWSHLGAQKKLGNPNDGGPNTIEPTAASSLYVTPWTTQGGSIATGAQLITGNIPPLFSTTGQYVFPSNSKDTTPKSLASTAWTGWFKWGASTPAHAPSVNPSASPTMAWPSALYPAYNGVVLSVESQILLANQGGAINLYYINLSTHNIVGLASLTNGGGLFSTMRVVSGMVLTDAASDLTGNGSTISSAFVYNEATGKRVSLPSGTTAMTNGFSDWTIYGGKVYNASNKLVADLKVPAAAITEPSAATFGVTK